MACICIHIVNRRFASCTAKEPFTYIDKALADKELFDKWLKVHEATMEDLNQAVKHIWFSPYCQLNAVSLKQFLDPSTARPMLHHWQSWVDEQDWC